METETKNLHRVDLSNVDLEGVWIGEGWEIVNGIFDTIDHNDSRRIEDFYIGDCWEIVNGHLTRKAVTA